MKKLIKNVSVITPEAELKNACIGIDGKYIDYIGTQIPEGYNEIIDGKGAIAMPGFVNSHTHIPMVLFRGYAEDMPLQEWLFTKIFPAEDKLDANMVKWASELAVAEMLASGTTSFSDMYYFCDQIVEAAGRSGIKANISRGVSAFAETDPSKLQSVIETKELFDKYHNSFDGRVKIDLSIHSEYTNNEAICKTMAQLAKERGAVLHIHISETEKEHKECIERHGITPTAFMEKCGCFENPVLGAHCVWLTDEDMEIFLRSGASVAHNPSSNLKLGSGIAPVSEMLARGINVCLGTDGCSSNNNTDMFTELHLASLLAKGSLCDPTAMPASLALKVATLNGAKAQGRDDTGVLEVGKCADIILVGTDKPNMHPVYSLTTAIVQSARAADVRMTMVNGEILYKDGKFTTIDYEKTVCEFEKIVDEIYR